MVFCGFFFFFVLQSECEHCERSAHPHILFVPAFACYIASMLKTLHTLSSYGFVLVFLVSCGLAAMALRRKEITYERLSAWSFVAASVLLGIAYGCGFPLEQAISGAPKAVSALAA